MASEVICYWCCRRLAKWSIGGKDYWTADDPGMTSWCPDAPAGGGSPRLHKPVPVIMPVADDAMGPIARMILEQAQYDAGMKLRARRREIADAMAVRGQWHEGTCTGCGLSDLPVIGLPGSEYCRYCEELRTLGPQEPEVRPESAAPAHRDIPHGARAALGMACLAVALSLILAGAAGIFIPGLFLVWGLMLLRRL